MRKLIAKGEMAPAKGQLKKPCSDCPLRRDSISGWLGGYTPEEYWSLCHSDVVVECHVHAGSRCAGIAIYRTHVIKSQPDAHKLPADKELVFAHSSEFIEHHTFKPFRKGTKS